MATSEDDEDFDTWNQDCGLAHAGNCATVCKLPLGRHHVDEGLTDFKQAKQ